MIQVEHLTKWYGQTQTVTMEGTTWEFTKEIPEDTDEAVWMLNGKSLCCLRRSDAVSLMEALNAILLG